MNKACSTKFHSYTFYIIINIVNGQTGWKYVCTNERIYQVSNTGSCGPLVSSKSYLTHCTKTLKGNVAF